MQNVKTHIVIGATEGKIDKATGKPERKIEVLYIGKSRHEAREIFLENKENLDFDFVGMDTLAGFKSRGRPKIDAQVAKDRAAAMAKQTEEEIFTKANRAKAAKEALGEAALKAKAEEEEAREKLAELVEKSGASLEEDDDIDIDEDEDEAELAALIAAEEEDEKNGK